MDSRKYFIVSVALIAIVTGTWLTWRVTSPPALPSTATVLPGTAELAKFSLLDQNGDTFTETDFNGHWNLLFFGFTHCPDICPLTLQTLANARQMMSENGAKQLPRIVLVSVDPERDTPQVIGQYVSHFGSDVVGLTGDIAETRKLTDGLGIYFAKSSIIDDTYSVDHSAVVVVVNPAGQFHALFSAPHVAENFVHDLPIIMSAQQAPLIAEDVVITRPLPGVRMSAGFLTLRNTSDAQIRISRVESPQLESLAMHESVLEDGIARMLPLSEVVVLAGDSVSFESGGKHLMIGHPEPSPDDVTLRFYSDETMLLSINVHLVE